MRLDELNKFKFQTDLVLKNKKIDDHKMMLKVFHQSVKLVVINADIDKAFRSMHQSVMTKTENFVREDQIVKTIVGHGIKISKCWYRPK